MRSILQTYLQDKTAFYAYKHPEDNEVHIDTIGETAPFDFNNLSDQKSSDAFVIFPFDSSDGRSGWYFTAKKQMVFPVSISMKSNLKSMASNLTR